MEDVVYEALANELMSEKAKEFIRDENGLETIKTLDLFNNQYRKEPEECAYGLPAVFIEFSNAIYNAQGRRTDKVQDRIRFHIEQKNFASSQYSSSSKARAIRILRYIRVIHQIIAGANLPEVGTMTRVARELDTDHGNAPVHILEYQVEYLNNDTDRYLNYKIVKGADLKLKGNVVKAISGPPEKETDNLYFVE